MIYQQSRQSLSTRSKDFHQFQLCGFLHMQFHGRKLVEILKLANYDITMLPMLKWDKQHKVWWIKHCFTNKTTQTVQGYRTMYLQLILLKSLIPTQNFNFECKFIYLQWLNMYKRMCIVHNRVYCANFSSNFLYCEYRTRIYLKFNDSTLYVQYIHARHSVFYNRDQ